MAKWQFRIETCGQNGFCLLEKGDNFFPFIFISFNQFNLFILTGSIVFSKNWPVQSGSEIGVKPVIVETLPTPNLFTSPIKSSPLFPLFLMELIGWVVTDYKEESKILVNGLQVCLDLLERV